ncbi:MAG: class I SAM-dependent methyltransferase [Gammaproteobacteria bacterium]|nr:class I SAM-dependent methyltransferase [Gammaproteobacteria bacterium]MDX2486426.1 class I SAM-dependent methyltransferase [Gammaproteobacteria bacterium]
MKKEIFKHKPLTAYDAIYEAQKIAYAPLVFQAVRTMRELGILAQLDEHKTGVSAMVIAEKLKLSLYSVETLLESGLSCGVVDIDDGEMYRLSKTGFYLLHDEMTRINMDYNHYICYQGMYQLDEACRTEKPAGLGVFGDQWETLYQALPHLPEKIKKSWYAFDHFYSDSAYPAALPIIFESRPATMLDIGTNVGKFSILAANYNADIHITMVDLPDQLKNAINNVADAGLSERIDSFPMDLLDTTQQFRKGIDIFWLSQFVSCFGKQEIISILQRIAEAMGENGRLYILETCWDRQQHEASAYSLINTSLYFTAIASGNSKMYHSDELVDCVNKAGLQVSKVYDNIGICHSLFECSIPAS